jgi:trk system potassium uptake protein TrkH
MLKSNSVYKTMIKQVASLQIILGLVMLVPSVVAIIYGEWYSLIGFIVAGAFTAILGYFIYKAFKETEEPKYKHSLAIAAIGWLMIIVLGALPYYVIAWITPWEVMQSFVPVGQEYQSSLINFQNPLHCIFESTSAFTTTGLTMAYHEPSVGRAINFYRHFSQFIGGAGFIVMALAIFRSLPGQGAVLMYGSEASGTKLRTNVIQTARAIWKVYILITLIVFVILFVGTIIILPNYPIAEAIFDSINHAMAGQSTGGFSNLDDSIATYKSPAMEWLYIFPMLIGGMSLPFLYRFVFLKQFSLIWKDIQTRAILLTSLFGGIVLSLFLYNAGIVPAPIREGMFQFATALTTTGWQTSNIGAWDDLSVLTIVFGAMIVGGCAGGTVGGIKIIRALLLQKGLRWHVSKVFHSTNTIKTVKFNGKLMLPDEMNSELARAGIFTLIYLIFVFLSTMITVYYMPENFTLADALFESASAQGTVGLSSGISDPSMSPVLETIYIIQMWAGRIEIIPVLVLLRILIYGTKPRIV